MSAEELVTELESAGVRLWEESGQLHFLAPRGTVTSDHREALRKNKASVLAYLRSGGENGALRPDPATRYEPFPLTDVQSAYLLGRRPSFRYGGVGCHGYAELVLPELGIERLQSAWRQLIARHDMLRAVVDIDGFQHVLAEVPDHQIPLQDLRFLGDAEQTAAIAAVRAEMDHRVYQPDQWPLFDLRATMCESRAILHLSIDFLIADYVSLYALLGELRELYLDPRAPLPAIETTFRDYVLAEQRLRDGSRYLADRAYWMEKLPEIPGAPELPLLSGSATGVTRFRRRQADLDEQVWAGLRAQAAENGLTASSVVLAAYAAVIAAWSRHPEFTLSLTLMNRRPLASDVALIVGDFTSVNLLAVHWDGTEPFARQARAIQDQMWLDLDHRTYSGVQVLREIARQRGPGAALMPVVFTSTAGLGQRDGSRNFLTDAEMGYGISQTPQVWVDCQLMERGQRASVNWDVREGIFPDGVIDDMFAAFSSLLRRLAADHGCWRAAHVVRLPGSQAARRREFNHVWAPLSDHRLLHDELMATAAADPRRPAVICDSGVVSFGELVTRATGVLHALQAQGARRGDRVGIVLEKSPEQVIAVLAALLGGCAYVPIDLSQPPLRRLRMLADAGVNHVLTSAGLAEDDWWPDGVTRLAVDTIPAAPAEEARWQAEPDDLAYVIYTSGSTGVPSGVMVTHSAARNTIDDINRRFGVGPEDRILGLANLGFDLSVYDIFGPPAAGGAIVLPDPDRHADPSHWAALAARHRVTVWNSVPAQMVMLRNFLNSRDSTTALPALRLVLLSGDWIPVTLPGEIRQMVGDAEIVSLGGATEAAIWSVFYPIGDVPPDWRSIPYGTPLTNQSLHVLDHTMHDRPEWVPGDLYIGGSGLARGYLGDDTKTRDRFVTHPVTGERLYRTGDIARYLGSGVIEFLGREDSQVKIRGHRIELAEITAALESHPGVAAAAAAVVGETVFDRRLAAFAAPGRSAAASGKRADAALLKEAARRAGDAVIAGADLTEYVEFNRRLDQAALLSMLDTLRRRGLFSHSTQRHTLTEILGQARVAPRHHRLVRRWLKALAENRLLDFDGRSYGDAAPTDAHILGRSWDEVAELQPRVDYDDVLISYFRTCTSHLSDMLSEADDPLQALFPQGSTQISLAAYRENLVNRWANSTIAAVMENETRGPGPSRKLRLLEVGAGVGGTTVDILRSLGEESTDYLFTDISQFFLNKARDTFSDYPQVRYALFDLNKDYREQGFEANSFDIIVGADVLHSVVDVRATLTRLRELLRPDGRLILIEMTRDHYQIMTSLEFLLQLDSPDGDFQDLRAGRDQTFLTRAQWQELITEAGGEVEVCLPEQGHALAEIGMHVFVARFKADRAAIDPDSLRAHVAARVPDYMVPASIHVVDELPLTPNGKIDQRTLGSWLPQQPAEAGTTRDEPETDLERALATIWADVLHLPSVGRTDTFFDLGGDSLLAAQISGRVREVLSEAVTIEFDELLRHILGGATVADQAVLLSAPRTDPGTGPPDARGGEAVPSPLVRALAVGPARPGPMRLVAPDASGLAAGVASSLSAMADDASWIGLEIADATSVLAGDAADHAEWLAGQFLGAIDLGGRETVEVVGAGAGSVVALEIARALAEAGINVRRLVIAGTVPSRLAIDDELLIEYLFGLSIGARPERLGYPDADTLASAVKSIVARSPGRVPQGALMSCPGIMDDRPGAQFAEIAQTPRSERIAALWRDSALTPPPPDDLACRVELFGSLLGQGSRMPSPYLGTTTVLRARPTALDFALGRTAEQFTSEVCLGELEVMQASASDPVWADVPSLQELACVLSGPAAGAGR